MHERVMVPDKQGRMVDIDDLPNGWKLTPRQRDDIYQQFLKCFPDQDCTSEQARAWVKLRGRQSEISPKRIRDFIGEAVAAQRGILDQSWAWWVDCPRKGAGDL